MQVRNPAPFGRPSAATASIVTTANRRLARGLAVVALVLAGCSQAGEPDPAGEPPHSVAANPTAGAAVEGGVNAELVRRNILLGTGGVCDNDAGCGPSGARGVCVLGTCFGLLTTDSGAARAVLAMRLAALPAPLADGVVDELSRTLQRAEAMPGVRLSAAVGVAAVAGARGAASCGQSCEVLKQLLDEPEVALAAVARHGLANAGERAVLAAVVRDLVDGTEHLRASAARSLAGLLGDGAAVSETQLALMAALDDPSPVVRRIAAEVLVAGRLDAAVSAALDRARRKHPADLRYVVDRGLYARSTGGQL